MSLTKQEDPTKFRERIIRLMADNPTPCGVSRSFHATIVYWKEVHRVSIGVYEDQYWADELELWVNAPVHSDLEDQFTAWCIHNLCKETASDAKTVYRELFAELRNRCEPLARDLKGVDAVKEQVALINEYMDMRKLERRMLEDGSLGHQNSSMLRERIIDRALSALNICIDGVDEDRAFVGSAFASYHYWSGKKDLLKCLINEFAYTR